LIVKDLEIHERKNRKEIRAFKTSSQKGFMKNPPSLMTEIK